MHSGEPTLLEGMAVTFVLPHAVACALLAVVLWALLPARYKSPLALGAVVFCFSIAFFIPPAGNSSASLLGVSRRCTCSASAKAVWRTLGVPGLPFRPFERSPLADVSGIGLGLAGRGFIWRLIPSGVLKRAAGGPGRHAVPMSQCRS